jgi:hypothetical protein
VFGEANYLRAAQAYILISMPTGTSTIFGHIQAIRELPSRGTIAAANHIKVMPKVAQAGLLLSLKPDE